MIARVGFLISIFAVPAAHANAGLVFGGDFGYAAKTGVKAPEVSNAGYSLGAKLGFTYDASNLVADAGLGYVIDKLSKNSVRIESRAFYSELGLRYRFGDSWSVGPQVNLLFGQDVSFSDVSLTTKSVAVLAGARVMYELPSWRFGLQALTDLDIAGRRVTRLQGVVEWVYRFGPRASATTNRDRPSSYESFPPATIEPQAPAPTPRPKPSPKNLTAPGDSFTLTQYGLNFVEGTTTLDTYSIVLLNRVAIVLGEYDAQWSPLVIEASTVALARSVMTELVANGIEPTKVKGAAEPANKRQVFIKFPGQTLKGEFLKAFKKALGTKK